MYQKTNIHDQDDKKSTTKDTNISIELEPKKHEVGWFNIIPPRLRSFPKAPSFLQPFLDMMIHNIMQTIALVISFQIIFYAISKKMPWWITALVIVFTYFGFGIYIHFIKENQLLYKTCFKCFEPIYDKLMGIPWWICATIEFPFLQIFLLIISMQQWLRRNKQQQQHPNLDLKNLKHAKLFWKMADEAYNVLDICVKSKQASIILILIQDLPLLVISCIIANILSAVVFSMIILVKLIFWWKHTRDVEQCGLPHQEDYYAHFGIKSVLEIGENWYKSYTPMLYTDEESERARWELRDPVNAYDDETKEWQIMIIIAIEKDDVIQVSEIGALSIETEEEIQQFVNENGVYRFDRWEKEAIKPLNDEEWIKVVNKMGLDKKGIEEEPLTASSTVNDDQVNGNDVEVTENQISSMHVNGAINTNKSEAEKEKVSVDDEVNDTTAVEVTGNQISLANNDTEVSNGATNNNGTETETVPMNDDETDSKNGLR